MAEPGVALLAQEITAWAQATDDHGDAPLCVVLPAGTGTTAFFLSRHLEGVHSCIFQK